MVGTSTRKTDLKKVLILKDSGWSVLDPHCIVKRGPAETKLKWPTEAVITS